MRPTRSTLALGSPFLTLLAAPALAQPSQAVAAQGSQDLSLLSIEELAQLTVRSASKRDEPLGAAPAALYLITGDEILNAAAHSLPEALRLAPNLNVQQVDAAQYAISARGFNSVETANKLLVLIDGRTVYTPLASTVFWELHNRPIEDIQQIEVISGPGGTLYGPNAVNGVVNVVTRDARETLGGMARGAVGERERSFVARYGVPLGTDGAIRFYGHWFDREDLPPGAGANGNDRFRGWQAGFRADLAPGRDHVTLQGDIFDNDLPNVIGEGNHGHNLLARWTRTLDEGSALQVQAYYDYFARDNLLVRDSLQTFDVEAQYTATFGAHDIVAGAGVRRVLDTSRPRSVPFALNHANPLTATAPLDRSELFWTWQAGHKFLRVDLLDAGREWSFHLGSTGCSSASALRPPAAPCAQPNVMRVEITGIDPLHQSIQLQLHEFVSSMRAAEHAICTGNYAHDPACADIFAKTGLQADTGACPNNRCEGQRLWSAE